MPIDHPLGELSYICIYNPTLDLDEKQLADQIVFFYGNSKDASPIPLQTQLRYIGLAQGVAEFSKYVFVVVFGK